MRLRKMKDNNEKRSWLIVALWFGSIALVGLLKRTLERQRPF
jgi:hypothetical protein